MGEEVVTLLGTLAFLVLSIFVYLLIVRLSRKDDRGRPFWRKLITPTPIDTFGSSDKKRDLGKTDSQHDGLPFK